MPFNCFKKLYESLVLPVIHYGSSIWGHQQFSSINSVHNKACRYFLGVNRYTANAAVQGDVGISPPIVDQHIAITRQWCRCINMDVNRLNRKIFVWANHYSKNDCKNWVYRTVKFYRSNGLDVLCDINNRVCKAYAVNMVSNVSFNLFICEWKKEICRVQGRRNGGNKLRTYCQMKHDFGTECYVESVLSKKRRSAIAKLRSGSAPIRIETGRYEGLPVEERKCPFCKDVVENEVHVITQCSLYDDLRSELYACISRIDPGFMYMNDVEKTYMILANQDFNVVKVAAKICLEILERRKYFSS